VVWCMTPEQADRRSAASDTLFIEALAAQIGERGLSITAIRARARYPLHEQSKDELVEHRLAYLGNAAQTMHPVAAQGLNLGLRDAVVLAQQIARCQAAGADLIGALQSYAQLRRADRGVILALTRNAPSLFATRFGPIALARSFGLTALAVVPDLRREFARLLMFGVRF